MIWCVTACQEYPEVISAQVVFKTLVLLLLLLLFLLLLLLSLQ